MIISIVFSFFKIVLKYLIHVLNLRQIFQDHCWKKLLKRVLCFRVFISIGPLETIVSQCIIVFTLIMVEDSLIRFRAHKERINPLKIYTKVTKGRLMNATKTISFVDKHFKWVTRNSRGVNKFIPRKFIMDLTLSVPTPFWPFCEVGA